LWRRWKKSDCGKIGDSRNDVEAAERIMEEDAGC
jgi:hypothetical protein